MNHTSPEELQHFVQLPEPAAGPLRQVLRRLVAALIVLLVTVFLVYLERDGYTDNADGEVSLLDCFYYTTVSLSTTGYGDIAPVSDSARLVNVLVITPLRVLFLIILIGTTLEVLAERTRQQFRLARWRSSLRDHTVIIGFGTKGRSAAETLISTGVPRERIVIIDPSRKVVEAANADGYTGVVGDATRSDVLLKAEVQRAAQVVISTQRDDTAVLVTLTARQLNRNLRIVAAVREEENAPLLRQSGADSVITSASAAGRLLGMSMLSPSAGAVMEDLIHQGTGLNLTERPVTKAEAGRSPRECKDLVVSVVRGHRVLGYDDPDAAVLELTDRLVVIRRATPSTTVMPSENPRR
ncbi:potassium channel family protein [Streptomyces pini]|uniref:Voltage-gated potassium channel n=1 Tax=Streptomyces pini TaxID=1520580 RepID=A0A1I4FLH3_9ACTN|nr:potassium channel protein [Streptomyces pini]SFL18772.1 voltage-gated potassium channel [Streptomyces pini]